MNGNFWLFLGGLAVGVIIYAADYYNRRQEEQGYEYSSSSNGGNYRSNLSEQDELVINTGNLDGQKRKRKYKGRNIPGPDEDCAICQDHLLRRDVQADCILSLPKCGHWFHKRCALRLLDYHPSCPICRVPIDSSKLRHQLQQATEEMDSLSSANDWQDLEILSESGDNGTGGTPSVEDSEARSSSSITRPKISIPSKKNE